MSKYKLTQTIEIQKIKQIHYVQFKLIKIFKEDK